MTNIIFIFTNKMAMEDFFYWLCDVGYKNKYQHGSRMYGNKIGYRCSVSSSGSLETAITKAQSYYAYLTHEATQQ